LLFFWPLVQTISLGLLVVIFFGLALFVYIWGWLHAKRLKLTRTMIIWTVGLILLIILPSAYFPFQGAGIIIPTYSIPIGVAIWGVIGSVIVGALLGLNAGYRGAWTDQGTMQVLDALIAFPQIVLYLVVIAALGQGDLVVILAITVTGAPGVARLVRSLTMDIKTRDYIRAAETRGESPWYIMIKETLPNARGPILVDSMLRVGYAIFAIGTLGFLGIGLPPPDPDWGSMVNDARSSIFSNAWAVIWPSLAIASLVIGLNLFADGLREELARYQR
jgi:peptide/nickel transport system permease protein